MAFEYCYEASMPLDSSNLICPVSAFKTGYLDWPSFLFLAGDGYVQMPGIQDPARIHIIPAHLLARFALSLVGKLPHPNVVVGAPGERLTLS
ncbi:uncharacterized protein VTP21DRAFT_2903 [Calcarisporiella thermophila]|uniref:uncharacterized protein n=1 Tax=Calcarisporiella thermophila TaxID=911321 RepID=UPI0037429169